MSYLQLMHFVITNHVTHLNLAQKKVWRRSIPGNCESRLDRYRSRQSSSVCLSTLPSPFLPQYCPHSSYTISKVGPHESFLCKQITSLTLSLCPNRFQETSSTMSFLSDFFPLMAPIFLLLLSRTLHKNFFIPTTRKIIFFSQLFAFKMVA